MKDRRGGKTKKTQGKRALQPLTDGPLYEKRQVIEGVQQPKKDPEDNRGIRPPTRGFKTFLVGQGQMPGAQKVLSSTDKWVAQSKRGGKLQKGYYRRAAGLNRRVA